MTTRIQSTLIALTLTAGLSALPVAAEQKDRHERTRGADRTHQEHRHETRDDTRRARDRTQTDHRAGGERIRLDLPVHLHGKARVDLKRLIRRHYDINPNRYRLVKVVVNNRNPRNATARLRVGHHNTGEQWLRPGRNHLRAPDGARRAEWRLGMRRAVVNNIRVVLEPRSREYASLRDRRDHRHRRYMKL